MLLGSTSFFGNLVTTVLIFLLLMSGYSLVSSLFQEATDVPLSAVAADVAAGKIQTITVNGDSLNLKYADESRKVSRKDPSSGLPNACDVWCDTCPARESLYRNTRTIKIPVLVPHARASF